MHPVGTPSVLVVGGGRVDGVRVHRQWKGCDGGWRMHPAGTPSLWGGDSVRGDCNLRVHRQCGWRVCGENAPCGYTVRVVGRGAEWMVCAENASEG